ncbi:MAG TPA: SusC/RagA family TonB-linked outer membrane protein, partial [Chitinophagales bacterium]|nr:SusC/RagA family TonB-linked outer membrane protein [Chitinophagales bacterium]
EVKYIGYKPKEVDIAKGNFNVVLEQDVLGLDEVVVTALGIKKEKRALGYSVQDLGGNDVTKAGNPNALSALSGKVAGLDVTTSSGQPGSSVNLRLRGATSLYTGDNQPLIVIDGVPVDNSQLSTNQNINLQPNNINGDINQNRGIDINPDDIDNISVLKGGAASALYGIQGANGVILITTKKGSVTGKKSYNVDISTSIQFDQVNKLPAEQNQWIQGSGGGLVYAPNDPNYYTPYVYFTHSWGAKSDTLYWSGDVNNYNAVFNGSGEPDSLSGYDKNGGIVGKSDPTAKTQFKPYENEKSFFRTGITTDNSFSISGGTDRGTFRFGFSNLYQNGIIPLSNLTKTTVSLAGEIKVGEKVSISGNANYVNSLTTGDLSGNDVASVMYGVYRTPISFDNRNGISGSYTNPGMYIAPDGHQRSYTYFLGRDANGNVSIFDNPYWSINQNLYKTNVNRLFGNIAMNADATDWLNFMGRVGVDFYSDRRKQDAAIEDAALPEGSVAEDQYFNRIINSDFIATLHHELAKNLNGSLFIGNNIYSNTYQNVFAYGDGLVLPNYFNIANAQTVTSLEGVSKKLTTAIYGGINLDWNSQIYFAFTARNEWSSTLPPSHRSFFYPGVDLGWVFTETAKLSTNKWFPYGKLRLSWAEVGNDAPTYALQNDYQQPAIGDGFSNNGIRFPFNGMAGFALDQYLKNPDLKPENTQNFEGGLDLRFMQSGIKVFGGFGIDFTGYYNKTTDEILPVPIANSSGYQYAYLNAGSVQNYGFEIMANITPVKVGDFRWDMAVNWSKNKSKVLSLSSGLNTFEVGGFGGSGAGNIYQVVGQPYGVIWGGDFYRDGSGNVIIDDRQTIGPDPNPNYGMPLGYKGDTVIGDPNPKWRMGWSNTFTWRGLSLSFLFDIKFGGQMYDGTRGALVTYGRAAETDVRDNSNYVFKGTPGHLAADGSVVTTGAANSNSVGVNFGAIDPATYQTYAEDWFSGNGGGFGPISSQFVEDAGYFRMRELTLAYSFEHRWLKNTKIKGIDIAFTARNLFLVTKYKGIDPDQALAGASNLQGIEWFNLPSTRSYGLTLKLHF